MCGFLGSDNIWLRYNYLKIWNLSVQINLNIEKIPFEVVQMKFLAMHITNQKLSCYIFTVGNLLNIFMECPNDFWHKIKNNFDPYNVFHSVYCYKYNPAPEDWSHINLFFTERILDIYFCHPINQKIARKKSPCF